MFYRICQKMEQDAFVNSIVCANQTFNLIEVPILIIFSGHVI